MIDYKQRASDLLNLYNNIDWEVYVKVSDEILKIDGAHIDNDLLSHSRQYSFIAGLFEKAKHETELAKNDLDSLLGSTKLEYNKVNGKMTVATLEAAVNSDLKVTKQKKLVADLEYKTNLFRSLVNAMSIKKDMIVQLSANNRAETNLYKN